MVGTNLDAYLVALVAALSGKDYTYDCSSVEADYRSRRCAEASEALPVETGRTGYSHGWQWSFAGRKDWNEDVDGVAAPAGSWIAEICLPRCAGAELGILRLRLEIGVAVALEVVIVACFQSFSPMAKYLIVKSRVRKDCRMVSVEPVVHGQVCRTVKMVMVMPLSGASAAPAKKSLLNQSQQLEAAPLQHWRKAGSCLLAG